MRQPTALRAAVHDLALPPRPGLRRGLLPTAGWQLTVAFFGGVILLACVTAANTNFEPATSGGGPAAVRSADVDRFTSDGGELTFGRRS